eukprot:3855934-Pleurochrysis_carterae.AAC.2
MHTHLRTLARMRTRSRTRAPLPSPRASVDDHAACQQSGVCVLRVRRCVGQARRLRAICSSPTSTARSARAKRRAPPALEMSSRVHGFWKCFSTLKITHAAAKLFCLQRSAMDSRLHTPMFISARLEAQPVACHKLTQPAAPALPVVKARPGGPVALYAGFLPLQHAPLHLAVGLCFARAGAHRRVEASDQAARAGDLRRVRDASLAGRQPALGCADPRARSSTRGSCSAHAHAYGAGVIRCGGFCLVQRFVHVMGRMGYAGKHCAGTST